MRKIYALSIALLCLLCRAGAEVLPAEKLLPDDTMLVLTMPDFNKMRDIFQNSPQGRLWNDPAMKDFKDKFVNKLSTDYITPLEHTLGVRFEDYTNLAQGQLTIALVQDSWQGQEGQSPSLLILLDTKDKSAQLKTNLTDLRKKWIDAGKTVKTETIRNVEFSAVTLSTQEVSKTLKKPIATLPNGTPVEPMEDPDASKPKKPLYIGQAESLLIICESPKVIEKVLVRMSGGTVKTVGDLANFDAHAAMFHDVPAYGWINTKAFVDVWGRPNNEPGANDASDPFSLRPDKLIGAIGLNGLKTIAFSFNAPADGSFFNVMLADPEANRTGLFKIMAGEAKDYLPPAFVPVEAVKFQRWRIDGQKTWATLRKMISDYNQTFIGGIDLLINSAEAVAKEKDPSFDINKALFGNLGDDIITYQKAPKGNTIAQLAAPPSIFLLSSPNPDQLASALKNLLVLYSQAAADPTTREFLGHKIYSIPMGPSMEGTNSATTHNLNYTTANGYVAITTDAGMIEEFLRCSDTPPKPLRETPGLTDAAQKVTGSGASLFGYASESQSMRAVFDNLKKETNSVNNVSTTMELAVLLNLPEVKLNDWLDFSLLPNYDKVSKYFYFSVYGGGATADGLYFKAFAPTPPDLNK